MKRTELVILAGISLCLPLTALAQDRDVLTAPMLTLERKRDVSIPDFEAALKKHLEFRRAEGEPALPATDVVGRYYQVYTPTEAGDYFKFYVRYCCVTLAQQDTADEHLYGSDIVSSYLEDLAPNLQNLSYQQQWIDSENSNWIWPATDEAGKVGVTTWKINPAKSIQMNEARARLSQIAKEHGKPNKWVWFTTVGGEETLSLAIPYENNAERGQVESFADFAAKHVGEQEARKLEQQFNEGFWSKDYKILSFRSDLSPKPKPKK